MMDDGGKREEGKLQVDARGAGGGGGGAVEGSELWLRLLLLEGC